MNIIVFFADFFIVNTTSHGHNRPAGGILYLREKYQGVFCLSGGVLYLREYMYLREEF